MTDQGPEDRDQKVRKRAHRLWIEDGCPEGRADSYYDLASELVAIEESQEVATIPVAAVHPGEPVEPIEALENAGEFPTTHDQGEMKIPDPERKQDEPL